MCPGYHCTICTVSDASSSAAVAALAVEPSAVRTSRLGTSDSGSLCVTCGAAASVERRGGAAAAAAALAAACGSTPAASASAASRAASRRRRAGLSGAGDGDAAADAVESVASSLPTRLHIRMPSPRRMRCRRPGAAHAARKFTPGGAEVVDAADGLAVACTAQNRLGVMRPPLRPHRRIRACVQPRLLVLTTPAWRACHSAAMCGLREVAGVSTPRACRTLAPPPPLQQAPPPRQPATECA
eukprot:359384-Chlamydomonas_euryale.AAC.1